MLNDVNDQNGSAKADLRFSLLLVDKRPVRILKDSRQMIMWSIHLMLSRSISNGTKKKRGDHPPDKRTSTALVT
jgi:hypothetical protein